MVAALVASGRNVTVLAAWPRDRARAASAEALCPAPIRWVRGRSWGTWQGAYFAAACVPVRRAEWVLAATWPLATGLPHVLPASTRLAVGVHGSDVTQLRGALPASLARRAYWLPVSQFLAARCREAGAQRVAPLPWPLPAWSQPVALPAARSGWVCVTRLIPGKGIRDTIRLAERTGTPLRIVGDGPDRANVEAWAAAASVSVQLTGAVSRDQAVAYMRAAEAVVLLSCPESQEGLGLCLLEGASVGTPAIGRAVGGVSEAVGPGVVFPADIPVEEWNLEPLRAMLADPLSGTHAQTALWAAHGPARTLAVFDALHRGRP